MAISLRTLFLYPEAELDRYLSTRINYSLNDVRKKRYMTLYYLTQEGRFDPSDEIWLRSPIAQLAMVSTDTEDDFKKYVFEEALSKCSISTPKEKVGITHDEYSYLPEGSEKIKYDPSVTEVDTPYGKVKYHKKRTTEEVDREIQRRRIEKEEKERKFQQRLIQIRNTPGIKITNEEYNNLPNDLKTGFEWNRRQEGNQRDPTIVYIKGLSHQEKQQEIQRFYEKVRNTPNIKLTQDEYNNHPNDLKTVFEWDRRQEGHQLDPTIYYIKGLNPSQRQQETERYYQHVLNDPDIKLDQKEYDALPVNIRNSIQWVTYNGGAQWDPYTMYRRKNAEDYKQETLNKLVNRFNDIRDREGTPTRQSPQDIELDVFRQGEGKIKWYFNPIVYKQLIDIKNEGISMGGNEGYFSLKYLS